MLMLHPGKNEMEREIKEKEVGTESSWSFFSKLISNTDKMYGFCMHSHFIHDYEKKIVFFFF